MENRKWEIGKRDWGLEKNWVQVIENRDQEMGNGR